MKLHFSINYLKQIGLWVWRGRYHILTFAAVICTALYLFRILTYYPNIVSALLSLSGLSIILTQQILDARQFADHKPNTMRDWVRSFPTGKPVVISVEGCVLCSSGGKAHVRVSVSGGATIEKKVAFVLEQVDCLQNEMAKIDDRIDLVAASLKHQTKELKSVLNDHSMSLKSTIAGHIVGAYDINLLAIIITICGTLIQLFCPILRQLPVAT